MKFSLRRIRIDRYGYTREGYYYGTGLPVFSAIADDCNREWEFRAMNREDAKSRVQGMWPDARFHR